MVFHFFKDNYHVIAHDNVQEPLFNLGYNILRLLCYERGQAVKKTWEAYCGLLITRTGLLA